MKAQTAQGLFDPLARKRSNARPQTRLGHRRYLRHDDHTLLEQPSFARLEQHVARLASALQIRGQGANHHAGDARVIEHILLKDQMGMRHRAAGFIRRNPIQIPAVDAT